MSSLIHPSLLGIGTAVPDRIMRQADWIPIADRIAPARVDRTVTERLARRSGIESRHCDTADQPDTATFYPPDPAGLGPSTSDRMARFTRAARPLAARAAAAQGPVTGGSCAVWRDRPGCVHRPRVGQNAAPAPGLPGPPECKTPTSCCRTSR